MNLAPFQSPLAALNDLRAAARGSKDRVALAWEREDGNVFRFDVPLPSRIAPKALPGIRHLVERVAKFVLWSAGGWRLRIAGPDAIVKPIVPTSTPARSSRRSSRSRRFRARRSAASS